jgi:hypothetical protein
LPATLLAFAQTIIVCWRSIRFSKFSGDCVAILPNAAINGGFNQISIREIPVDAFTRFRSFEVLGDVFSYATVAQLTSIPHFYDGRAHAMFLAVNQNQEGEHLASALSVPPLSLWFWTGNTNVTTKLKQFKQFISGSSEGLGWSAMDSKRPVSEWNWIHLASVKYLSSNDFQTLLDKGLPAPALAGLNTLFLTNSSTFSKLPADAFQYFLSDSASLFTARTLNVRSFPDRQPLNFWTYLSLRLQWLPLEAMEAFNAEMYSKFMSFDGLDASHVASLDPQKLQFLPCATVLSIKPEQLVASRQVIVDEINKLRKYSCQDGYLPPIAAGPIVVPPPYHDNLPVAASPSDQVLAPDSKDAQSMLPFVIGSTVGGVVLLLIIVVVVIAIRRYKSGGKHKETVVGEQSDLKKPLMESQYNSFSP